MALATIQKISLDLHRSMYQTLTAQQYDTNTQKLYISCFDNGVLINLTGYSAYVKIKTPDEQYYKLADAKYLTIDGNQIIVTFPMAIFLQPGTAKMEVVLTEGATKQMATMKFNYLIERSVYSDDEIISDPEIKNALKEIEMELEAIKDEAKEWEELAKQWAIGDNEELAEEPSDTNNSYYYSQVAKDHKDASKLSEDNAKVSEDNAKVSEDNAKESETNAEESKVLSKKWAVGETIETELDTPSDTNNAYYYNLQSKDSSDKAKVSEDNAKESELVAIEKEIEVVTNSNLTQKWTIGENIEYKEKKPLLPLKGEVSKTYTFSPAIEINKDDTIVISFNNKFDTENVLNERIDFTLDTDATITGNTYIEYDSTDKMNYRYIVLSVTNGGTINSISYSKSITTEESEIYNLFLKVFDKDKAIDVPTDTNNAYYWNSISKQYYDGSVLSASQASQSEQNASDSEELAKKWAVGITGSGIEEPSDINNAYYYYTSSKGFVGEAKEWAVGITEIEGKTEASDTNNAYYYNQQALLSAQSAHESAEFAAASLISAKDIIDLTQAEYDALSEEEKNNGYIYNITDADYLPIGEIQDLIDAYVNTKYIEIDNYITTKESAIDTKVSTATTTIDNKVTSAETEINGYINTAKGHSDNAESYSDLAKSYAVGTDGVKRTNDATDNAKYYKEQAELLVRSVGNALVPKGTISFSELASQEKVAGYMYNIKDAFTTTDEFRSGAGIQVAKGAYVYYTADNVWDVLASSGTGSGEGTHEEISTEEPENQTEGEYWIKEYN